MTAPTILRIIAALTLLFQLVILAYTVQHCRYHYRFRTWDKAWHWFAVKVLMMIAVRGWVLLHVVITPALDALFSLINSVILCMFLHYLLKIFHNTGGEDAL